jgi:hypothetical protein
MPSDFGTSRRGSSVGLSPTLLRRRQPQCNDRGQVEHQGGTKLVRVEPAPREAGDRRLSLLPSASREPAPPNGATTGGHLDRDHGQEVPSENDHGLWPVRRRGAPEAGGGSQKTLSATQGAARCLRQALVLTASASFPPGVLGHSMRIAMPSEGFTDSPARVSPSVPPDAELCPCPSTLLLGHPQPSSPAIPPQDRGRAASAPPAGFGGRQRMTRRTCVQAETARSWCTASESIGAHPTQRTSQPAPVGVRGRPSSHGHRPSPSNGFT